MTTTVLVYNLIRCIASRLLQQQVRSSFVCENRAKKPAQAYFRVPFAKIQPTTGIVDLAQAQAAV